jgi:hypothetical protein
MRLAQQDKERYEKEMAEFNAAGGRRGFKKEANSDDSDE